MAVPPITPKLLLPTVAPGPPNCVVLNALNISTRNWTLYFSLKVLFLKNDRSQFLIPGLRTSGMVRGVLPKLKDGAAENCVVSNHLLFWSLVVPPSIRALLDRALGRWPWLQIPALF